MHCWKVGGRNGTQPVTKQPSGSSGRPVVRSIAMGEAQAGERGALCVLAQGRFIPLSLLIRENRRIEEAHQAAKAVCVTLSVYASIVTVVDQHRVVSLEDHIPWLDVVVVTTWNAVPH